MASNKYKNSLQEALKTVYAYGGKVDMGNNKTSYADGGELPKGATVSKEDYEAAKKHYYDNLSLEGQRQPSYNKSKEHEVMMKNAKYYEPGGEWNVNPIKDAAYQVGNTLRSWGNQAFDTHYASGGQLGMPGITPEGMPDNAGTGGDSGESAIRPGGTNPHGVADYTGRTHENGGIPIGDDVEVEDGEFKFDDMVFSNRLPFDNKGKKTFADEAKKTHKKYAKRLATGDSKAKTAAKRELSGLFSQQEMFKQSEIAEAMPQGYSDSGREKLFLGALIGPAAGLLAGAGKSIVGSINDKKNEKDKAQYLADNPVGSLDGMSKDIAESISDGRQDKADAEFDNREFKGMEAINTGLGLIGTAGSIAGSMIGGEGDTDVELAKGGRMKYALGGPFKLNEFEYDKNDSVGTGRKPLVQPNAFEDYSLDLNNSGTEITDAFGIKTMDNVVGDPIPEEKEPNVVDWRSRLEDSGLSGMDVAKYGLVGLNALRNKNLTERPEPNEGQYLSYMEDDMDVRNVEAYNQIDSDAGATAMKLENTGNMSGATLRSNLLALNNQKSRAKSSVAQQDFITNLDRDDKRRYFNKGIDEKNAAKRKKVDIENRMDKSAYEDQVRTNMNSTTQNFLSILNEAQNRGSVERMSSLKYGNRGYKTTAEQREARLDEQKRKKAERQAERQAKKQNKRN